MPSLGEGEWVASNHRDWKHAGEEEALPVPGLFLLHLARARKEAEHSTKAHRADALPLHTTAECSSFVPLADIQDPATSQGQKRHGIWSHTETQ